jgi:hypothetical protein
VLLKVLDGTVRGDTKALCYRCRYATIVKGGGGELISCGEIYHNEGKDLMKIQPVYQCSSFDDKSMPSLGHMKSIAWELLPDKKSGKIGFQKPVRERAPITNPLSGEIEY